MLMPVLWLSAGAKESRRGLGEGTNDAPKVVVLDPEVEGGDKAEGALVAAGIRNALRAAGMESVSAAQLASFREAHKSWFDCAAELYCRRAIADGLFAQLILSSRLYRQRETLVADLELLDFNLAMPFPRGKAECFGCSAVSDNYFKQRLGRTVAVLVNLYRSPISRLVIHTRPSPSPVWIDGQPIGNTDVELALPVNRYRLRFGDGADAFEKDVDVRAGTTYVDEVIPMPASRPAGTAPADKRR